jgi:hypothetical protein
MKAISPSLQISDFGFGICLPLLLLGMFLPLSPARAFPPAPYYLIYGEVRDRYGSPLTSPQAQIILQPPSGVSTTATLVPGYAPGVNYQMKVPMDAGQTPDLWQPNALLPAALFRMVVVIGTVTNIPIEMTISNVTYAVGQPGGSARVDLTLGVDANGDGLPDAWELAFLASLGLNVPLSSLTANSILTPDGLTLRQQYLLGTYPFDPGDPLKILFTGLTNGYPVLQFPTVTGRTYTVLGSSDLMNWSPASFVLAGDRPSAPTRGFYYAPNISTVQIYVAPPAGGAHAQFYKLLVQ